MKYTANNLLYLIIMPVVTAVVVDVAAVVAVAVVTAAVVDVVVAVVAVAVVTAVVVDVVAVEPNKSYW